MQHHPGVRQNPGAQDEKAAGRPAFPEDLKNLRAALARLRSELSAATELDVNAQDRTTSQFTDALARIHWLVAQVRHHGRFCYLFEQVRSAERPEPKAMLIICHPEGRLFLAADIGLLLCSQRRHRGWILSADSCSTASLFAGFSNSEYRTGTSMFHTPRHT